MRVVPEIDASPQDTAQNNGQNNGQDNGQDNGYGTPKMRRYGFIVMAITFLADQISKMWLLFGADIIQKGPFQVTSFFELTVVWNRGVSYGMMQQSTDTGRWLLIIGSLVAASWMTAIMWRAPDRLTAASLALVVGGALGNAVDRVMYHAVFDFAHIYVGDWSWYVFNVADAAIVVGVVGLLYDAIAEGRWKKNGKPA